MSGILAAGDTHAVDVWLQDFDASSQRVVYADYAAFTAAGWTAELLEDGVAAGTPGFALTHIGTVGEYDEGLHRLTCTLSQCSDCRVIVRPPTGGGERWGVKPAVHPLGKVEAADADALNARLVAAAGRAIVPDRLTRYDFSVVEGAAFYEQVTIPAANLSVLGISDLSDATISVAAAARLQASQFAADPEADDAEFLAVVSDTVNRVVDLSWPIMPPGLALGAVPADAGTDVASKTFFWDLDVSVNKANAVTGVATGAGGTFTVAGDQRRWYRAGQTLTISGSTGNDGTYTIASVALSGGNTVFTVSESVPNATADGTATVTVTATPVRGQLTVLRQEHR